MAGGVAYLTTVLTGALSHGSGDIYRNLGYQVTGFQPANSGRCFPLSVTVWACFTLIQ